MFSMVVKHHDTPVVLTHPTVTTHASVMTDKGLELHALVVDKLHHAFILVDSIQNNNTLRPLAKIRTSVDASASVDRDFTAVRREWDVVEIINTFTVSGYNPNYGSPSFNSKIWPQLAPNQENQLIMDTVPFFHDLFKICIESDALGFLFIPEDTEVPGEGTSLFLKAETLTIDVTVATNSRFSNVLSNVSFDNSDRTLFWHRELLSADNAFPHQRGHMQVSMPILMETVRAKLTEMYELHRIVPTVMTVTPEQTQTQDVDKPTANIYNTSAIAPNVLQSIEGFTQALNDRQFSVKDLIKRFKIVEAANLNQTLNSKLGAYTGKQWICSQQGNYNDDDGQLFLLTHGADKDTYVLLIRNGAYIGGVMLDHDKVADVVSMADVRIFKLRATWRSDADQTSKFPLLMQKELNNKDITNSKLHSIFLTFITYMNDLKTRIDNDQMLMSLPIFEDSCFKFTS